jgi:hypothetical protein
MKKRRVTLNIDEDVLETLESVEGRSLSDTANRALRAAATAIAHRRALVTWLDELDAVDGGPSEADYEIANRLLDEVFGTIADSFAA